MLAFLGSRSNVYKIMAMVCNNMILKDLTQVFLMIKSLKQAKIISAFSVQLFLISPRKRFIRILKSVRLTIPGRLLSSAFVCVAPRPSAFDHTRILQGSNAEPRRRTRKTADESRRPGIVNRTDFKMRIKRFLGEIDKS